MSILEVARVAGVSKSTVSLVINGSHQVADETAAKVRKAMAKIGYEPRPQHKRGGRRKRASVLKQCTLLSFSSSAKIFDAAVHPYYAELLSGVEASCRQRQINFAFLHLSENEDLTALSGRRDGGNGLLLFGGVGASPVEKVLSSLPCVTLFGSRRPRHFGDWVSYDDVVVGELAIQELMDRGCRRIAVPEGDFFQRGPAARRYGSAHGVEMIPLAQELPLMREGRPYEPGLLRWIDVLKTTQADGLFLPNDQSIALLYPYLKNAGLDPDGKLHIVGCNNSEVYRFGLSPRPATIDIRPYAVGEAAVAQLIRRMENPRDPWTNHLLLPELICADTFPKSPDSPEDEEC